MALRNSGWNRDSGTLKHIHIVMTSQSFNKPFVGICLASGNHHTSWCSLVIPYCFVLRIFSFEWDKFRISLPLTCHLDRLVLRILSRAQRTKSSWIYDFLCKFFSFQFGKCVQSLQCLLKHLANDEQIHMLELLPVTVCRCGILIEYYN